MKKSLRYLFIVLIFLGCGVKGKPLSPLEKPYIGGKPTEEKKAVKKPTTSTKKNEEVSQ